MTENELRHHGILGQKWGVRRFQNPDGTLTAAGKRRYKSDLKITDKLKDVEYLKDPEKFHKIVNNTKFAKDFYKANAPKIWKAERPFNNSLLEYAQEKEIASRKANEHAYKTTGIKGNKIYEMVNSGDEEKKKKAGEYLAAGQDFVEKYYKENANIRKAADSVVYNKTVYDNTTREYEKKASEFIKEILGASAEMKVKGSVSVDLKSGKVSESTLSTLAAIEMLRSAKNAERVHWGLG